MRIFIANDQHWPMKSGVATAARTLAQGPPMLATQLWLLSVSAQAWFVQIDENHEITRIRAFGCCLQEFARFWLHDREMRRIIDEFEPDVVHAQYSAYGVWHATCGRKPRRASSGY